MLTPQSMPLALIGAIWLGATDDGSEPSPLYPHPVITEVLFNVPKGDTGDANADGERHPSGDEFVELFNPHPKTINLRGYTITNRLTTGDKSTKRGVRFEFPDFKLGPGEIVVVFNGCEASISGPLGTPKRAPKSPNELFAGAWVFTMGNRNKNNAFSNSADFVLLTSPKGRPIDCIFWNEPDPPPPSKTMRTAEARKNPKGSVQRTTADADPEPHVDLDDRTCSPGELPAVAVVEETDED